MAGRMLTWDHGGPVELVFDLTGDNIELDALMEEGGLKIETQLKQVKQAAYGDAAIGHITAGVLVELETTFTSDTDMEKMAAMWPGAVYLQGTVVTTTEQITINNPVGEFTYDLAKALIIKPVVNNVASVAPEEWTYLDKVYPTAAVQVGVGTDQVSWKVMWKVYPNRETGFKGKFGTIGLAN